MENALGGAERLEPITISSICLYNVPVAQTAVIHGGSPLAAESQCCYNSLEVYDDLYIFELKFVKHFLYFHVQKKKKVYN